MPRVLFTGFVKVVQDGDRHFSLVAAPLEEIVYELDKKSCLPMDGLFTSNRRCVLRLQWMDLREGVQSLSKAIATIESLIELGGNKLKLFKSGIQITVCDCDYEANAKVAEVEAKTVEAERGRMKGENQAITVVIGREQLKRSGLGKVIMFLSKSDNANRQLAKDLVENWNRTIFNKSAWYSDLGITQEKVVIPMKKKQSAMQVREDDLDLKSRPPKQSYTSRQDTVSVPKPSPCVYAVNPQSKIARGGSRYEKSRGRDCYKRIEKNMRMLKKSKRKPLQVTKLGVNGRSCFGI
ncbi:hypothetical protein V6N11_054197 [Hibiscus sabdariffa]|uniref:TFIIS N-terminal domain-containing protein n=1 Tax=Hibiscus sabdariffa TaxID=183260 RepID=A0ABR2S3U3_9ROSI